MERKQSSGGQVWIGKIRDGIDDKRILQAVSIKVYE